MKAYTYLLVNLFCIIIPFVASFYPPKAFVREWRWFIPANLQVALVFLLWDSWFTHLGVWGFNPDYLTGIYIGNLPLEELLFFICIPYACTFTYFALRYLIKRNPLQAIQQLITITLAVLFLVIAAGFYDRAYTSATFFLAGLYLLIAHYQKRPLADIYLSYLVIIPFFLVSNGLLTGTFIDEQVVWYNHTENMDLRIGTIPVEDSVYGFLMIMMNIEGYEWLKKRFPRREAL